MDRQKCQHQIWIDVLRKKLIDKLFEFLVTEASENKLVELDEFVFLYTQVAEQSFIALRLADQIQY